MNCYERHAFTRQFLSPGVRPIPDEIPGLFEGIGLLSDAN